ncbi:nuclear transport factor 2 family protein, partial [Actinoplanes subtropicus]|uniref:nuclear transport factor 2 family protein n=1 Tax=Actinoplanes subtropicus TaxID=543632 RepID=UPI0004C47028
MSARNKEMVLHFYEELFGRGNLAVIDEYLGDEYIQHNPHAPNGADALRGFVTGFRQRFPGLRHTIVHAIAEDDLVLLHSKAELAPGTVQGVADLFRVRDGKVVEHWDVLQEMPETTAGGNDVFATLSAPGGPESSTAESKKVVTALFTELAEGRDPTAWDRYAAEPYYEHNPTQPNGLAAAKAAFAAAFENPHFSMGLKRVIAEGDQVAVHHDLKFAADGPGAAVIDIFRVRDGRVVEHWDIVQPIPATSANDNTMF